MSVNRFIQFRDDILDKVVEYYIARLDRVEAIATVNRFHNKTRGATAMLNLSIAIAKSGDLKMARIVAAQIMLGQGQPVLPQEPKLDKDGFDYRQPQTWTINYEWNGSFTVGSYAIKMRHTAELACAAIRLSHALGMARSESYSKMFSDEIIGDIIFENLYADFGFQESAKLLGKLIAVDGTINYVGLDKVTQILLESQDKNKNPFFQ